MATTGLVSPGEQSDAPHGSGRAGARAPKWRYVLVAIVAVAVLAGAVIWAFADPEPETAPLSWPEMAPPQSVEAPQGLDGDAPQPTPEGIEATLGPLLDGKTLKGKTTATVFDASTGDTLLDVDGGKKLTPASSTKVATAAAALATRGPAYRIPTRVVEGEKPGDVVLIAQGDVTMSADGDGFYPGAASLQDLADQVVDSLGAEPKRVFIDTSAFSGDDLAPGVPKADVATGQTAFMEPLMFDGGRVDPDGESNSVKRYDDPLGAVTKMFGKQLGGVTVAEGEAPADAKELGAVYSPTLQRLSDIAMVDSDNLLADALGRQVALAQDKPGSFEGGAEATREVLKELKIPTEGMALQDGSGLSPKGKLTANTLAGILQVAGSGKEPRLSGLFSGLPVGGFTGTLDKRFSGDNADGAGKVRAKTGSLTKVSTLTGMVVTADGRLLTYAFMYNGKGNYYEVSDKIDGLPTALTECGCR